MIKTYLNKNSKNSLNTVMPAAYVSIFRQRLNNEPMTDLKSFHIAKNIYEVKYTHDEEKNQLPKVIYL